MLNMVNYRGDGVLWVENVVKMKTNKEVTMALLTTLIRFGIIKKHPLDFPMFMVWFKDVKRYSEKYGIKDEA